MQRYVFHSICFVLSTANEINVFSGFPEGKYQIKLTDSAAYAREFKLNLVFDHRIGTISGDSIADVTIRGDTFQWTVIIKGFHDCEHAYFTVEHATQIPIFYYWTCSVFGTGSRMIDELVATCVDFHDKAKVHYVKLTPV